MKCLCGYSEVENYYIILSDVFVEVFNLGQESMRHD